MSTQHPEHPNLVVFEHPLIQHKLSFIRDAKTGYRPFRALLAQIAGLMVFEVTRSFATTSLDVQTPMETTRCQRIAGTITLVPILRAGLGMTEGILDIMPEARVAHLGMARDEQTLQPKVYLQKFPKNLGDGPVVIVDPMLATGGSAVQAVSILKSLGASDLRMICLVAAPQGVGFMGSVHPDVRIYAAAMDRQLNEHGFILPGLGDAGDRMYGT